MESFSLNEATGNCENSVSGSMAASVALGVIGSSIGSGSLVFLGLHIYRKKKSSDMVKTGENPVV